MNVSQYDQMFTQFFRYAGGLMKSETKKTKRFVKGLKLKIKAKLVPLQLRIFEKAQEVEMDIQESQEDWARELFVSKCPRY